MVPAASLPGCLLQRDGRISFGFACGSLFPDFPVGGVKDGKDLRPDHGAVRRQVSAYTLCGEDVAVFSKPVSSVWHGVDAVSVVPQGLHRLPDGGAGDRECFRDLFSGKIASFIVFKKNKQLFLCFHYIHLWLHTVSHPRLKCQPKS